MSTNVHVGRLLDVLGEASGARRRSWRPRQVEKLRHDVEGLFEILDTLGLHPAEVFTAVYGTGEGRGIPEIFLENLESQTGKTLLAGRVDRLLRLGTPTPCAPRKEVRHRLAAIDEKRFDSPAEARPLAHELLADVLREVELGREDAGSLCDALAQTGSVECGLGDYPEAAVFLFRGLKLSRRLDDPRREASLLRRCASLLSGLGENRVALVVVERAVRLCVLSHNLPDLGKSLFGRGMLLRRLGDVADAVVCYRSALSYLPAEAWQHRFCALQSLAIALLVEERVGEARTAADEAMHEHRTREGLNWWKLMWFRGDVALRSDDLREAETLFRQAREVFESEGDHVDVALISLRLAKALLLAGKETELRRVVADLLDLLQPLMAENRIAGEIVGDLAKKALVEDVTMDFLDRAHEKIYKSTTA